mmetsp:Transcript_44336/g.111448  ORF Transcript_44336/g.111448 Transcript_44336/m.111448 type:complete len:241 (-) Transcript_44336:402-1124(-)
MRCRLRIPMLAHWIHRRRYEVGADLPHRRWHRTVLGQRVAVVPPCRRHLLREPVLRHSGVGLIENDDLVGGAVRAEGQLDVLVHRRHVLRSDVLHGLSRLLQKHLVGASVLQLLERLEEAEGHDAPLVLLDVRVQRYLRTPAGGEEEGGDAGVERHAIQVCADALWGPSLPRHRGSEGRQESRSRLSVRQLSLVPSGVRSPRSLLRPLARGQRARRPRRGVYGVGHVEHVRRVAAVQDHG